MQMPAINNALTCIDTLLITERPLINLFPLIPKT